MNLPQTCKLDVVIQKCTFYTCIQCLFKVQQNKPVIKENVETLDKHGTLLHKKLLKVSSL